MTERNSSALSVSDESRERTSITLDRFALLREAFSALQTRMEKKFARVSRGLTPTAAAPIPSPPIIPSSGTRRLASSAMSTLARRVMPSYFAYGGMGFLARASQDVSFRGRHLQMSDGVHEITVDEITVDDTVTLLER